MVLYASLATGLVAASSTVPGFFGLVALQIVLGWVANRKWALLLPVVCLPLLEGWLDPNPSEDIRGFASLAEFTLALFVPIALALVGIAIGVRRIADGRRRV